MSGRMLIEPLISILNLIANFINEMINYYRSNNNAFKKLLGFTATFALLLQALFAPGLFTVNSASAQGSDRIAVCLPTGAAGWNYVEADANAWQGFSQQGAFLFEGDVNLSRSEKVEWCATKALDNEIKDTVPQRSLKVTKVVVGGTKVAADFPLFVNGMPITSGVATTTLGAGNYTVTETNQPNYVASFSGHCNAQGKVTLVPGQHRTCVITNTYTPTPVATSTLTVLKVVSGGDKVVADFPLFVNGMPITSGVATTTLAAGTYTVSEHSAPNYSATFSGHCDAQGKVTLVPGQHRTCVITNTYTPIPAATTTLAVTKVVVGGNHTAASFPLFVNGMPITSGVATTTLAAGTYTVSESNLPNYIATFSGSCNAQGQVTVVEGQHYHCVITNTFVGGGVGTSQPPINVNVTTGNVNVTTGGATATATGGNVNLVLGTTSPIFVPQVLGATSYVPVTYFPGQVLGAASVPGFPATGGDPTVAAASESNSANTMLLALMGLVAAVGMGIILIPNSSSRVSSRTRADK
jgi:hypothetical protein